MKTNPTHNEPARPAGGFPCPRCKCLIQFPFQALLTQPSIFCTHCGLELEIDGHRSATALEELRRYAAGMEDARRMLDDSQPGDGKPG